MAIDRAESDDTPRRFGSYTTARVSAGRVERVERHVRRLQRDAARLGLPPPDATQTEHLLLETARRAFGPGDGIVRVVLAEEARGDYVLQMYDIRDLTFTPTDYKTADFNLLPSGADPESFTARVAEDDPVPLITQDTLPPLITHNPAADPRQRGNLPFRGRIPGHDGRHGPVARPSIPST